MKQKVWGSPRNTFCWLDDKRVLVVTCDQDDLNGHCELLDTVSVCSKC